MVGVGVIELARVRARARVGVRVRVRARVVERHVQAEHLAEGVCQRVARRVKAVRRLGPQPVWWKAVESALEYDCGKGAPLAP